jgi:hypothetical protein
LALKNQYSIEQQYRIFTVRPASDFDRKTVGRGIEYYTDVDDDTAMLDSVSATTNDAVIHICVMEVHNVDALIGLARIHHVLHLVPKAFFATFEYHENRALTAVISWLE